MRWGGAKWFEVVMKVMRVRGVCAYEGRGGVHTNFDFPYLLHILHILRMNDSYAYFANLHVLYILHIKHVKHIVHIMSCIILNAGV